MKDLFGTPLKPTVVMSEDRVYRYVWRLPLAPPSRHPRVVNFLMLNPSTADENKTDPTVERCIDFARP